MKIIIPTVEVVLWYNLDNVSEASIVIELSHRLGIQHCIPAVPVQIMIQLLTNEPRKAPNDGCNGLSPTALLGDLDGTPYSWF